MPEVKPAAYHRCALAVRSPAAFSDATISAFDVGAEAKLTALQTVTLPAGAVGLAAR